MLTTMSTKAQAVDEIEAAIREQRRRRTAAEPRSTADMIDACIAIYNRELQQLERASELQDLTPDQHETLRQVTQSTIALHRALTVQVPDSEEKDLSGVSTAELRKAAK